MLKRKRAVLVIDPEDLSDGRSESDSVHGDTSDSDFRLHEDGTANDTSSRDRFPQEPSRRKCDDDIPAGASAREVDGHAKADSGFRFQKTDGRSNVVTRPDLDSIDRTKSSGAIRANNATEATDATELVKEQGGPVLAVQSAGGEDATPPEAEMDDLDALAADIPCDTLAAVHFLRASFPPSLSKVASSLPPFALLSQIYTVVPHRTTVDRELEMLQRSGSVRVIRLMSARTDIAVLLSQDYAQVVEAARQQFLQRASSHAGNIAPLAQKGDSSSRGNSGGYRNKSSYRQENSRRKRGTSETESSQVAVFYWFRDRVLPQCTEHGISRQQLERLLSNAGKSRVTDSHICILVQAGLLVAQVAHVDSYWFSLPNIGSFTQHLTKGRSDIIGLLQHSKFGEMLKSKLEVRKKHKAVIPVSFILRDLMGQGRITRRDSTVGEVLRLCNWTRR